MWQEYPGSSWSKWDLHVHTPASLDQNYGGDTDEVWEKFIADLEALPSEVKVLGINDYLFVDGYEKVMTYKKNGRLENIALILPVLEFRIDSFSGTEHSLSRVNVHVIFSDEVSPAQIRSQFISSISSKYKLTPGISDVDWSGVIDKEHLINFGQSIIDTMPEGKSVSGGPLKVGFSNLCVSIKDIQDRVRDSSVLRGKVLIAVGKTEWADIKWTEQIIAEKKDILNKSDIVFTAIDNPDNYKKSRDSLSNAGVNDILLDCSDAHAYSDSQNKDRIGNCFTWIKAEHTFEGLKQVLYEPEYRLLVSRNAPLPPIKHLDKVELNFPEESTIEDEPFCLRGEHKFNLSPWMTCFIGGRGVGKSTILNLIHESLSPGKNQFFQRNVIETHDEKPLSDHVLMDGGEGHQYVEVLTQNQIESFAKDPENLADTIWLRLDVLDEESELSDLLTRSKEQGLQGEYCVDKILSVYSLRQDLSSVKAEIKTLQRITETLNDNEYLALTNKIREVSEGINRLRQAKNDLKKIRSKIRVDLEELEKPDHLEFESEKLLEEVRISLEFLAHRFPGDLDSLDSEVEARLISNLENERAGLQTYLEKRGLSEKSIRDLSDASERLSYLKSQEIKLEKSISSLRREVAEIKDGLDPMREETLAAIEELISPLMEAFESTSDQVESIEVDYEFNVDIAYQSWVEILVDILDRIGSEQPRIDQVAELFKPMLMDNDFQAEKFRKLIRESSKEKTSRQLEIFLKDDDLIDVLSLAWWIHHQDVRKYVQFNIKYGGRPLTALSFGQRCTATIVILLLLGTDPLIIDEPEAHLDSLLIATYLVGVIKEVKRHRQLIFATHNANIVVNGDAERVFILRQTESGVTEATPITLEDLTHRENILSLEGGNEAFEARETKYRSKAVSGG